jgi:hypothetical protein
MGSGQLRRHRQQGSRRSFAYSLAAEYLPSAKLIAKSIGDERMKDFCDDASATVVSSQGETKDG